MPASTHTTAKTHFSPSSNSCTRWLTIQPLAARYWCLKLPGLLLLWLFSEACQTFTSVRVAFKWLHIPLASRQLAVIHHTTGWWVWPWIYLLCVICGGENDTNGKVRKPKNRISRIFPPTIAVCWLCQSIS